MQHILLKTYSWEELADLGRDVYEAIQYSNIDGEFEGTIKIDIVYDEERETLEDWEE